MQYTYIYSLQSEDGIVKYIGKTDYPNDRLAVHKCNATYKNPHLKRWMDKVNKITLEIIDVVLKEDWKFWEKWYISLFKSWGFNLCNLTDGGDGCDGFKHSEESKRKMVENHANVKGKNNPMYGKIGAMLGKKHTEESLLKMRLKAKKGQNNPMFGKTISEEIKDKLRKTKGEKTTINGIIYDSVRQACEKLGISRTTFRYKTKKGFVYDGSAWAKF